MNDSNAKTMYETVPAAAELNKVPGFDPLKFLRRTKDTLKLDLPYQKLWFRMAHPNGRMRLTALISWMPKPATVRAWLRASFWAAFTKARLSWGVCWAGLILNGSASLGPRNTLASKITI